jgi:hypothetical protein
MRNRITLWTALFLLVMSGAALGALVGSMFCAAEAQAAASDNVATVALQAQSNPDSNDCPLATLAEFVASPMVVSPVPLLSVMRPAYVAPLYLSPRYRVDPEPPTKPPSA